MQICHSGIDLHFRFGAPAQAYTSYQYQLLRMLLGTVSVGRDGKMFKQEKDFSYMPPRTQSDSPGIAVKSFINGFNMKSQDKFIVATSQENRNFYKEIFHDVGNYFIATSKESHVSAFVFLYRVLERMLYSTPLIYASTSREFEGTFNDLKVLLQGKDDGELSLYDKAICGGKFIDAIVLDYTYQIDFSGSGAYKVGYYNVMDKYFAKVMDNRDAHSCQADLKFRHTGKCLYTIRNRFFHTKTGASQPNILTSDIGDAEGFFKVMNGIFISYLSIVLIELMAWGRR